MTDLDLDAIRAREQAATQDIGDGWEAVEGTYEDSAEVWATKPHRRFVAAVIDTDEELVRPVNPVLAFIAAAPGDVRSLIAAVQRRDDALAAVLALCDRAERNYGGPTGMANLEAWVHLGSVRAAITAHLAPADNPTTED